VGEDQLGASERESALHTTTANRCEGLPDVGHALVPGGGKDDAGQIVNFILQAEGAHNASYTGFDSSCGDPVNRDRRLEGPVAYGAWSTLFSGRSVTGPVCFQVAANDVASLMLHSTGQGDKSGLVSFPNIKSMWFALK
jgi:hypothetical protein